MACLNVHDFPPALSTTPNKNAGVSCCCLSLRSTKQPLKGIRGANCVHFWRNIRQIFELYVTRGRCRAIGNASVLGGTEASTDRARGWGVAPSAGRIL